MVGAGCLLIVVGVAWALISEALGDALRGSATDPDERQSSALSRYQTDLKTAGADGSFTEAEVTASVGEYWQGSVTAEELRIVVHVPGESTSPQCFELRATVTPGGVDVTRSSLDDGC
ncbi:hypothetical protein, partial [Promicromonospora sp. NPDC060271]|uniref:hypothetical protein n=1 Tax=Promicromonospora sp. NPDC060271 TaxID=3347089 RepID=UPI00365D85BC